jgi:hypothetical protein
VATSPMKRRQQVSKPRVAPILGFALWMARTIPDLQWCRYADDGVPRRREEEVAM